MTPHYTLRDPLDEILQACKYRNDPHIITHVEPDGGAVVLRNKQAICMLALNVLNEYTGVITKGVSFYIYHASKHRWAKLEGFTADDVVTQLNNQVIEECSMDKLINTLCS